MDIVTQSGFGECELGLCDGSGITLKTVSPEDVEEDFCLCEVGQNLDKRTEDNYEQFDVSSVHIYPFHKFGEI